MFSLRFQLINTPIPGFNRLSQPIGNAGKQVFVGFESPRSPAMSLDAIDHSSWDKLLRKHIDTDGMVNYEQWRSSQNDLGLLNQYVNNLSSADPKMSARHESKLAFWINPYNAVTVSGILMEYPTSSIRNHTAKVVGYNIWKDYQLYVRGTPYSLDSMERKVLRKMQERRIHFAIVCASIACPRSLNEAHTAERLPDQLDRNARDFFRRPQNFRHDARRNQFQMSAIMDWFGSEFGSDKTAQMRTLRTGCRQKWLKRRLSKAALW